LKLPTLTELIDRSIAENHARLALRNTRAIPGEEPEITYEALGSLVHRLAVGLQELGVTVGDRVAILSRPRIRFAASVLAIFRLGAWVVPVDPTHTAEEIEVVLRHAGVRIALTTHDLLDRVPHDVTAIDFDDRRQPTFSSVLRDGPQPAAAIDEDSVAVLAYTSGTTGDPKGVMLTHGNIAADLIHGTKVIPVYSDDVFLAIAPWHHILGLVACLILPLYGGALALYTDEYRRLADLMQTHGVSIFVGVPKLHHALYERLLAKVEASTVTRILHRVAPRVIGRGIKKRLTGGRLRFLVSGSAPLDPGVAMGFRRMGIGMMEGYGLTETSPVISLSDPFSRKSGSVGRPIPEVEARILDPWPDGVGELLIRGPIVMKGYYRNTQATEQAIDPDGWFHTGDLACLDETGEIFLKGRAKNVIVLESGKNVYPEELEWEIGRIPHVEEVLVRYRESDGAIEAIVYPNQERLQADGMLKRAREHIWNEVRTRLERLAPYKRLRSIRQLVLTDRPFPKTSTLDIKRHLFRFEERKDARP